MLPTEQMTGRSENDAGNPCGPGVGFGESKPVSGAAAVLATSPVSHIHNPPTTMLHLPRCTIWPPHQSKSKFWGIDVIQKILAAFLLCSSVNSIGQNSVKPLVLIKAGSLFDAQRTLQQKPGDSR
jgi:hypothetical protein